jgi:hypothetical protein
MDRTSCEHLPHSADEQHEYFTAMQQNLNHIVETGSNHMLSVATADGI